VVRDGSFPDGFERRPAQLHGRGIVGDLLAQWLAVAAEVVEHRPALVQQPEVVSWQGDSGGEPPRKPAQFLARLDGRPGPVPLEPDVIAHRLRHDACPADAHAGTGHAPHQVQPLTPLGVLGCVVTAAGSQEPLKTVFLVVGGVRIAHLQMGCRLPARGEQFRPLLSRQRLHRPPPVGGSSASWGHG
jgi:hypothetical protein